MTAAAVLGLAAASASAGTIITLDNFTRAETDYYMSTYVAKGCFAKLCNDREPTPVDKQPVVRMNRDTLYSVAVFDLASPVTIVKPDTGKRFQSMVVINQDHYIPLVAYHAGTYTLTQGQVGTRNAIVLFRTFVDPNDPNDISAAHAAQDGIRVSQASPGKFEVPDWDQDQRKKVSGAVAALMAFVPDSRGMFGAADKVDPVRHLVGTAAGWGGNPEEDAKYLTIVPKANDGATAHVLKVQDVPVDGFWSMTVYNANGFFEAPANAISVNNITAKRDADGSVTIHLGGDPKSTNFLRIMPGWSYVVRLYRPRAEILNSTWTFPEPEAVR
ncbi:MAG: hypothetical protein B7Y80_12810 [Hyphomicrobium sp. 32-62-53]|jgi:hypothetical protein|nr:MAG: hypothetical protein B7Z29_00100 [Hyphomicrobium sp. 12-62-95]OYX99370.1 MAG: hypothetical protein B7Y80_12810 [Hyphomicrobium sp. 32-62-53]